MSKIGKKNIVIPKDSSIKIEGADLTISGPKGTKKLTINDKIFSSKLNESKFQIQPLEKKVDKKTSIMWGTYRSLINNAVIGSSSGYEKILELVGVGYRASNQGQKLDLALGFSHNILLDIAPEVKIETISEKGKNPIVKLTSHDKQLVGFVAAKIRSFRKPEPYKGKGIKFVGEQIRRKAGKSA